MKQKNEKNTAHIGWSRREKIFETWKLHLRPLLSPCIREKYIYIVYNFFFAVLKWNEGISSTTVMQFYEIFAVRLWGLVWLFSFSSFQINLRNEQPGLEIPSFRNLFSKICNIYHHILSWYWNIRMVKEQTFIGFTSRIKYIFLS